MNKKKNKIGNIYKGIYGDFEVIERIDYDKGTSYKVRFVETGYETIGNSRYIKDESILKDKLTPTICGVGITGDFDKEENNYYNTWRQIIKRCYMKNYAPNHKEKNITVCEEWKYLRNFINDMKKIEGWDEQKYNSGELVLDKDKKTNMGSNVEYNLQNCSWLTKKENDSYQSSCKFFTAEKDGKVLKRHSIKAFAKEINQNEKTIANALKTEKRTKSGWKCKYVN